MNNFSPNMLKTFNNCPKKYYFRYIQNISMPQPATFFEKGKKIHALAHYYLQGADISNMINALNDDEKLIWQRLSENKFFNKKYVNSEYNLSCKVGDYWVGGRLDALMYEDEVNAPSQEEVLTFGCRYSEQNYLRSLPASFASLRAVRGRMPLRYANAQDDVCEESRSNKEMGQFNSSNDKLQKANYYILDYKTGSIPKNPETDFQTMVYLICADRKIKEYKSLNFVYIDLKNNQNYSIELTQERKELYVKTLTDVCEYISNIKEYPQNAEKCSFCEYKKLCI